MAGLLVTGGAGFIGSHLVETLLGEGHEVTVLDDFSSGRRENLSFAVPGPRFRLIEGDLRDRRVLVEALDGAEYVLHEAAIPSVPRSIEDPLATHAVNVDGTLNLLVAAKERGVRKVVYASSCAVYGDDPTLPKREETALRPLSPYALQKRVGELYCRLFSDLYRLPTLCLRYFNVFGPRQDPGSVYSAVIPRFIDALIEGRPPVVYGDGEQSRDFVYVGDVVRANLMALFGECGDGAAVNVGWGEGTSLNRLLSILREELNSTVAAVYEPSREGDIRHSVSDIGRAGRLLGFRPDTGIETGLRKTVAWFREERERGGRG